MRLVAWIGGTGNAPTTGVNQYIGSTGFVADAADAVDIRGAQGAQGNPGSGGGGQAVPRGASNPTNIAVGAQPEAGGTDEYASIAHRHGFPLSGLPKWLISAQIKDLENAVRLGGFDIVPNAMAQLESTTQPNQAALTAATYGDAFTVSFRRQNYWFGFRVPTQTDLETYRIRVGDSDGQDTFVSLRADTATQIAESVGGFDYYAIQIVDKPAADSVVLVDETPLQLDIAVPRNLLLGDAPAALPSGAANQFLTYVAGTGWVGRQSATDADVLFTVDDAINAVIADGAIDPGKLNGELVAGQVAVVNAAADGFDGQRLLPSQQLYAGSVGLFIASLSGDTAQQVFTFQDGVSIGPQSHGVVLAAGEGQLTNPGSTQIGFNSSSLLKLDKQGSHSLEAIERSADYLATGSDNGLQTIVYDIWDLGRHQGEVVVRLAKARGRFNQGNIDYLPDADATSTASVNFTWAGEVLLIGTAGTRGQDGVGGIYLVDAVPTDSAGWGNYVDGDIIIAKPDAQANRGVWVKESTTTHGSASTGLGGLTLDPSTNLVQIAVGRFTHQRYSAAAYPNPRGTGNIPAGSAWGSAPSGLSYLDFDYSTNTRADGEVHLKYTSPQTYTGDIEIRAGSAVVHLNNIDSTTWRVTGLQAPVVEQLRSNDWTFTEVGVTTTTIVHSGVQVANFAAAITPLQLSNRLPLAASVAAAGDGAAASRDNHTHPLAELAVDRNYLAADQTRTSTGSVVLYDQNITAPGFYVVAATAFIRNRSNGEAEIRLRLRRTPQGSSAITHTHEGGDYAAGEDTWIAIGAIMDVALNDRIVIDVSITYRGTSGQVQVKGGSNNTSWSMARIGT